MHCYSFSCSKFRNSGVSINTSQKGKGYKRIQSRDEIEILIKFSQQKICLNSRIIYFIIIDFKTCKPLTENIFFALGVMVQNLYVPALIQNVLKCLGQIYIKAEWKVHYVRGFDMFTSCYGFYVKTKQRAAKVVGNFWKTPALLFATPHHNTRGGSEIGPLTFEKLTACARTPFKSASPFQ